MDKGYTLNVLDKGFVRYVDHMGDDKRILEAARISYKSPSKGDEQDKKLLHYLWKNHHSSPFEMCKITFNIKMPIFIMRQFVRHRMQNLNEVSGRYTELLDEFYIPEVWRKPDLKNRQGSLPDKDFNPENATKSYEEQLKNCYKTYKELIDKGVAREMARMILPVSIYTEIYTTWDLKNLLHYFTLRDSGYATWEHQEYAKAMKQITTELYPWVMEAYNKYKWKLI